MVARSRWETARGRSGRDGNQVYRQRVVKPSRRLVVAVISLAALLGSPATAVDDSLGAGASVNLRSGNAAPVLRFAQDEPTPAATPGGERPRRTSTERPSVVFILLDTTRADRFGAWGNSLPTSTALDSLARDGILFVHHYANSHATRPSMPQIMSGRYYHRSVLRSFDARRRPREYYFIEPDPTSVLLPELLRNKGYYTVAVSTHPWVVRDSPLGRFFDRFEFLAADSTRGHQNATTAIDHALELWRSRPRDRPVLLYVHLMDMHMPRWLPGGLLRFADPSLQWRHRFSAGLEPKFGAERRYWDHNDAGDFNAEDRAIYRAAYDTMLSYTDRELARLLTAVRAEDPHLDTTLVAVAADHGEDLGEEGRIRHGDSLSDFVQRVPFILAGAGIQPGQRFEAFSENVDITPTIARLLDLDRDLPAATFDGRPLLKRDGLACEHCGHHAAYYAWVHYQAIRTAHWLFRIDTEGEPRPSCAPARGSLWKIDGSLRKQIDIKGRSAGVAARLRGHLESRLAPRAARFRSGPRSTPDKSFEIPAEYWRLNDGVNLTCPSDGAEFEPGGVSESGWNYVRRSFLVIADATRAPLRASVEAVDGRYDVDLGIVPIRKFWWLPAWGHWLRDAFHTDTPTEFVPLGTFDVTRGRLSLSVPASTARHRRVLSLRLTPVSADGTRGSTAPTPTDREQIERLRTLGYVE